jgi:hypothetical protein
LVPNKTPSSTAIYLYADTVFESRAELWRLVGGEYFSRMWAKKIWKEHVMSENLIALKERLAERALDLCEHLFPEGQCRYGKSYVGDLDGKPFVFADGSTGKGRTVGSPSYPVGSFPLKKMCSSARDRPISSRPTTSSGLNSRKSMLCQN